MFNRQPQFHADRLRTIAEALAEYRAGSYDDLPAHLRRTLVRRTRNQRRELLGDDALARRQRLAEIIEERRDGRRIHVVEWGRDCDMCESTRVYTMPASALAFEHRRERMYEWAEGPCSMHIVSAEEAAEVSPGHRDLIAEAHEDGHPHVVYV